MEEVVYYAVAVVGSQGWKGNVHSFEQFDGSTEVGLVKIMEGNGFGWH